MPLGLGRLVPVKQPGHLVLLSTAVLAIFAGVIALGAVVIFSAPGSHGDLLLDWQVTDNTATSVGTIDSSCQSFTAGTTVRIDAIASSAVDWASFGFRFGRPIASVGASVPVVTIPGPSDGFGGGGFDFIFVGAPGAQNFLFPDSSDTNDSYASTQAVPDSTRRAHGISLFDGGAKGNSGSGGIARISLDTTGMAPGLYVLLLVTDLAFAGGVHSNASGFRTDSAVEVIAGFLDIDGDSAITGADDGTFAGIKVIDGALDINRDDSITTADDGFLSGYEVIDGALDMGVTNIGSIDSDDKGFLLASALMAIGESCPQDETEVPNADKANAGAWENSEATPVACDDTNTGINPDALDPPGDGIDQDCDGIDQPPTSYSDTR